MPLIRGKEKAWGAFLGGGALPATVTLALAAASFFGLVPVPEEALIAGAITSMVNAIFAFLGAYIPTNSEPTNISVPAEATPAEPHDPADDTVNPIVLPPRPAFRPEGT